MSYYSPSIEKLIEAFERLPSIGSKTAARLAFYMLNASEEETNEFISAVQNVTTFQIQIHAQYVVILQEIYLQFVL